MVIAISNNIAIIKIGVSPCRAYGVLPVRVVIAPSKIAVVCGGSWDIILPRWLMMADMPVLVARTMSLADSNARVWE